MPLYTVYWPPDPLHSKLATEKPASVDHNFRPSLKICSAVLQYFALLSMQSMPGGASNCMSSGVFNTIICLTLNIENVVELIFEAMQTTNTPIIRSWCYCSKALKNTVWLDHNFSIKCILKTFLICLNIFLCFRVSNRLGRRHKVFWLSVHPILASTTSQWRLE